MVHKFDFHFSPAKEDRRIHLYLPDNYDSTDERYPVLYMFDGHNLYFDSDATYGKSLGLKEFLDWWGKKLIVVGIECSSEDLQRVHEYCPYHIESAIYGDVKGRGDATVAWIVNDLKPYIDKTYRTYPFREATAIAGYSMGGMLTLYTVLHYNDVFSKAAVISPSVVPAMEPFRKEVQGKLSPDTRIFFSWGTAEYAQSYNELVAKYILELEKEVQKQDVKTYLFCQEGGEHNEGSWQHQVPTWMQFLWF